MTLLADLEAQSWQVTTLLPITLAIATWLSAQISEPNALYITLAFVGGNVASFLIYHVQEGLGIFASAFLTSRIAATYLFTVFGIIGVYRVYFHRLSQFPGPTSLALSKWSSMSFDLAGSRPVYMQQLHRQYGDVVRIGPRELSINIVGAISAIYATGLQKGPWYECLAITRKEARSLHTLKTMKAHNERRRQWDGAFRSSALKGYELNVQRNVEKAIDALLDKADGKTTQDIGHWLDWLTMDIVTELGVGRSFHMLDTANTAKEIELIQESLAVLMPMGNVAGYIRDILAYLPSPTAAIESWCRETVRQRIRDGPALVEQDIFSYILGERQAQGDRIDLDELTAEAFLLLGAGSDTAGNAMGLVIFNLITTDSGRCWQKLRKELDTAFPQRDISASDVGSYETQRRLSYLTACIDESLRLYPSVPSGLQRVTSPAGLKLPDGSIIPPGVIISTPTYTMQRDPRNFTDPELYRPERWIEQDKTGDVFTASAFTAFGAGPTQCIGKQLGYMEMRLFLARFVQNFDVNLAPHIDPDTFRNNIKDRFVIFKDPLQLILSKRN
ncbi:cytochrome P450 [Ceraceosorus guamensis]|uniref:Cytochrome P450 n=1 Tax=Ceraceosorus guamensis TaxID=1522189 RepID=A0A316W5B4_9BASI|nr:cytochrome P450 [Ceraceosorus guamensis]PWN45019.1 cytochrome P450 [Ceraceosorus guamensis]